MQAETMSEANTYSNEVLDQGLYAARLQLHDAWGMIPQIIEQLAESDDHFTENDSDLEGETDEETDEESDEEIGEDTDEQPDSVYISDTDEGDGEVTEHENDHRLEPDDETDQESDEDVDSVYIIDGDDEEQKLDCSCGLMDHDSVCNAEQRLRHHAEHDFAANISEMGQHGHLGQSVEYAVPSSPTPRHRRKRSLGSSSEGQYTLATKRRKHNDENPHDASWCS